MICSIQIPLVCGAAQTRHTRDNRLLRGGRANANQSRFNPSLPTRPFLRNISHSFAKMKEKNPDRNSNSNKEKRERKRGGHHQLLVRFHAYRSCQGVKGTPSRIKGDSNRGPASRVHATSPRIAEFYTYIPVLRGVRGMMRKTRIGSSHSDWPVSKRGVQTQNTRRSSRRHTPSSTLPVSLRSLVPRPGTRQSDRVQSREKRNGSEYLP